MISTASGDTSPAGYVPSATVSLTPPGCAPTSGLRTMSPYRTPSSSPIPKPASMRTTKGGTPHVGKTTLAAAAPEEEEGHHTTEGRDAATR